MLPGVDHLPHTHDLARNAFSRGQPAHGVELADATVGQVGLGAAGFGIASLAIDAGAKRVVAFDPNPAAVAQAVCVFEILGFFIGLLVKAQPGIFGWALVDWRELVLACAFLTTCTAALVSATVRIPQKSGTP